METEPEHPAKEVSDGELKAALNDICEQTGQPVARIKDVVKHDSIDVGGSAVNKRFSGMVNSGELGKVKSGSGTVYWVAEEGEGGEVDPELLSGNIINWDSSDPTRAPDKFIEAAIVEMEYSDAEAMVKAHPEHEEVTRWQELNRRASDQINLGGPLFIIGVSLVVLAQGSLSEQLPTYLQVPQWLGNLGLLALLGSFFTIFISVGIMIFSAAGKRLENTMVAEWATTVARAIKAAYGRIPMLKIERK